MQERRIDTSEIGQHIHLSDCSLHPINGASKRASQRAGDAHLLECLYHRKQGGWELDCRKGWENLSSFCSLTELLSKRLPHRTRNRAKHGLWLSQIWIVLLTREQRTDHDRTAHRYGEMKAPGCAFLTQERN